MDNLIKGSYLRATFWRMADEHTRHGRRIKIKTINLVLEIVRSGEKEGKEEADTGEKKKERKAGWEKSREKGKTNIMLVTLGFVKKRKREKGKDIDEEK